MLLHGKAAKLAGQQKAGLSSEKYSLSAMGNEMKPNTIEEDGQIGAILLRLQGCSTLTT